MPGNAWSEEVFRFLLTAEQRRSRRSGQPFVLTILNAMETFGEQRDVLHAALPVVAAAVRETDIVGWIEEPNVLGIIFTQLDSLRTHPNMSVVQAKLERALQEKLGVRPLASIAISSHVFAEPLETLQFEHADETRGQLASVQ